MRLLSTSTYSLQNFNDAELKALGPGYAILSHRWQDGEITFDDFTSNPDRQQKPGYAKIRGCCDIARQDGFEFVWIDTCCIDKSNTTELAESINSMYRWYSEATVCYAFLVDVANATDIAASEWFNRGWTLQELIAPGELKFYNREWNYIGHKNDFAPVLSMVTKIPTEVLTGLELPRSCSVAQRMSWAANRTTTRIEDRAYSLLGLFDVVMPMLYGERENAFVRLQEEIIKRSADQTIFAWAVDTPEVVIDLFARSPASFEGCSQYLPTSLSQNFSMTNTGLSIELGVIPYSLEVYLAVLDVKEIGRQGYLAISLAKLPIDGKYVRFCRSKTTGVDHVSLDRVERRVIVHIQQSATDSLSPVILPFPGFWLRTLDIPSHDIYKPKVLSQRHVDESDRVAFEDGSIHTAGMVWMEPRSRNVHIKTSKWFHIRLLKFGFDAAFNPMCLIGNLKGDASWGDRAWYFDYCRSLDLYPHNSVESSRGLFDGGWVHEQGQIPTLGHRWPRGFVVLKGDRRSGLNMTLNVLNIKVTMSRCRDYCARSRAPLGSETATVWTVDIKHIEGYSPENLCSRFWTSLSDKVCNPPGGMCSFICSLLSDRMCYCFDPDPSDSSYLSHQNRSRPLNSSNDKDWSLTQQRSGRLS